MTRVTRPRARRGFTLIELLVVMALIAALSALTIGLLPDILNKDNTLKGTAEVQGALRIAQAQAGVAKLPRGVRFLPNPANPQISTEMQYLEAPQVTVSALQVLSNPNFQTNPPTDVILAPRVEFRYDFDTTGRVVNRHCYLLGLTTEQQGQISDGATLSIPPLGSWSRIASVYNASTGEVVLEVYPDPFLGAAGPPNTGTAQNGVAVYRSYHFGIYGAPVPQLGEPTVPLPQNVAVDLNLCLPAGGGANYDIMFAPSGQTIATFGTPRVAANAGVFLWVRDVTKVPALNPLTRPTALAPATPWTFNYQDFLRGGEQQVVGIRNGYVGTAPVLWPNGTGAYTNQDPYTLGRQRLD